MQTGNHSVRQVKNIYCPVCSSRGRRTVLAARRGDGVLVISYRRRIYETTPGTQLSSAFCDHCKSDLVFDADDRGAVVPVQNKLVAASTKIADLLDSGELTSGALVAVLVDATTGEHAEFV